MSDSVIIKCRLSLVEPKDKWQKITLVRPTRNHLKEYEFSDHPEFKPNLSPKEMFHEGIFGGGYFRPIYSCVTKKSYHDAWKEFPEGWFPKDIKKYVASEEYDIEVNKYKVKCGQGLREWEENSWIYSQSPYGWVQWYCRFFNGIRSYDDERQISRFNKCCGPKGRWKTNLINKIKKKAKEKGKPASEFLNDYTISPVIRQVLLHWGFSLNSI